MYVHNSKILNLIDKDFKENKVTLCSLNVDGNWVIVSEDKDFKENKVFICICVLSVTNELITEDKDFKETKDL